MDNIKNTAKTYGFLWKRSAPDSAINKWHYNAMQKAIDEPIVRGRMGIEVGSGCGYDSYIMAKNNPLTTLVSIDLSDGIFETKKRVAGLGNVIPIKCSALEIPLKNDTFDFAYSYGVLHHTSDPKRSLKEICRILKKNAPAFLYLYEDHSENIIKYTLLKIVTCIRFISTRVPKKILYALAWLISPIIFVIFTIPSRILRKFDITRHIGENMPFNFGTGFFSLQGSLYDRFGAPIEHRFSRQEIFDMFSECGISKIRVTRLHDTAGWVIWGYKN